MQKFKQFAGFLAAVLTVGSSAFAAEYFIPDGSGDSFFLQMKNALEKCAGGDVVTIGEGVYQLGDDETMSSGDSAFSFPVKNVTVRGDLSVAREKIVIRGGSRYRVFYTSNRSCRIENLTFEGCTNALSGAVVSASTTKSTMVVSNCVFRFNTCLGNSNGGGVCRYGTFFDCAFSNNVATTGSAGALRDCDVSSSHFEANEATGGGACRDCAAFDCIFVRNESTSGNGGAMSAGSAEKCFFAGNVAAQHGGAMAGGSVTRCRFGKNSVKNGSTGQGRCLSGTEASDCVFDGENEDVSTAALCSYGIVYGGNFTRCAFRNYNAYSLFRGEADAKFVNCLFQNVNSGYVALRTEDAKTLTLLNVTVADCSWGTSGFVRCGQFVSDNSIYFNNKSNGVRNDLKLLIKGSGASGVCNVYGEAADFPLKDASNFQVAKVNFVGEGEHPYQLTYKQKDARIRTGGAVGDWTADDKDLAGNPRLHGEGAAATISLGCYECWEKAAGLMLLIR